MTDRTPEDRHPFRLAIGAMLLVLALGLVVFDWQGRAAARQEVETELARMRTLPPGQGESERIAARFRRTGFDNRGIIAKLLDLKAYPEERLKDFTLSWIGVAAAMAGVGMLVFSKARARGTSGS